MRDAKTSAFEPEEVNPVALPLKGIRILELDQDIVGCYGTLPVTALGAEVITIQPHKGDTGQGQTVDWP